MSRIFQVFALFIGTLATQFSLAQTSSDQALRLLCENHNVSAYDLMTLRSDSVTDFIPATISSYTLDGKKLFDLRQVYLVSSNGLNAEAYVVAKAGGTDFSLYHLEISFALKSAKAHLVTDNLTARSVDFYYTVAADGLWVHGQKDALQFYGFHNQKINRTLKLEGQLASRRHLVVKSVNSSGVEQLKLWNEAQNTWALIAQGQSKNQKLELASEENLNWVLASEPAAFGSSTWKVLYQGQSVALDLKATSRPLVFSHNSQTFLAWSKEGLDANRRFTGQLQWVALNSGLKQGPQKKLSLPDSIKTLIEKNNSSGGQVFKPVAFDANQKAIIFTSGNLGGAARLNLQTETFELFGAYGSSWSCYNPAVMIEVTTW